MSKTKSKEIWYCYVMSEACDWFVIPFDKRKHWNDVGRQGNDDGTYPEYATYVPHLKFKEWSTY